MEITDSTNNHIDNPANTGMKPGQSKILIVEDEVIFAEDLRETLEELGYTVCSIIRSAEEALSEIRQLMPDLILIDIVLSGKMNGLELAGIIQTRWEIPFIFLTSNVESDTIGSAIQTSPYGYIPKPSDRNALYSAIEIALARNKTDRVLRESEEKHRSFMENIQDIAYQYDFYGEPIFFYGAVKKITGYSAEEFTAGKVKWIDLILAEDREKNFVIRGESAGLGLLRPGSKVYRILSRDGEIRWIHDQTRMMYRSSEADPYYEGLIHDITPIKQLESDLKTACNIRTLILLASGHFLRHSLTNFTKNRETAGLTALKSALMDIAGGIGYEMNIPFIYLCQMETDHEGIPVYTHVLRWDHPKIIPGNEYNGLNDALSWKTGFFQWDDQLRKGFPVYGCIDEFPQKVKSRLEEMGFFSVAAIPIFCDDRFWGFLLGARTEKTRGWTDYEISSLQLSADVIAMMIEYNTIITEVPLSNEKPAVSADNPDPSQPALVEDSIDIVFVTNNSGEITYLNKAGASLLTKDPDPGTGKSRYDIFSASVKEMLRVMPDRPEVLSEGYRKEVELDSFEKTIVLEITLSPIRSVMDPQVLFTGIARDITWQKKIQKKQSEIQKKLQLMHKIFRHDINNHITAIMGYLSLSKDTSENPAFKDFVQKEEFVVDSMRKSLQLARTYETLGENPAAWMDLWRTFKEAWARFEHGVVFLDLPEQNVEIFADPLFTTVVYNLLDNTLQHGGKNLTSIRVSVDQSAETLVIIYQDNGAGVPEEYKEKIFNREYYTNNGFGMLLSREILSMTGMTIRETGRPGKGARFEITVPAGSWHIRDGVR